MRGSRAQRARRISSAPGGVAMPEMSPNVPTSDAVSEAESRTQPPAEPTTSRTVGPLPGARSAYGRRAGRGRGGMGMVYRAHGLAPDREGAVKLLRDGYGPESAAARRFLEEAKITGQLQPPSIPAVHQTGATPDGRP